ncbi:MAG: lytic transglycosylase domain-containing protein [Bacteriovoracia bacterium]
MAALLITSGFFMVSLQAKPLHAPQNRFATKSKTRALTKRISAFLKTQRLHNHVPDLEKFSRLIVDLARAHQFEPAFILAVLGTESGFDPNAISNQGAVGLMQVMPRTADFISDNCGYAKEDLIDLFDPFTNVSLGVCYLSYLRGLYGNDMDRILSAYNLGPARVSSGDYTRYPTVRDYCKRVKKLFTQFTLWMG